MLFNISISLGPSSPYRFCTPADNVALIQVGLFVGLFVGWLIALRRLASYLSGSMPYFGVSRFANYQP